MRKTPPALARIGSPRVTQFFALAAALLLATAPLPYRLPAGAAAKPLRTLTHLSQHDLGGSAAALARARPNTQLRAARAARLRERLSRRVRRLLSGGYFQNIIAAPTRL